MSDAITLDMIRDDVENLADAGYALSHAIEAMTDDEAPPPQLLNGMRYLIEFLTNQALGIISNAKKIGVTGQFGDELASNINMLKVLSNTIQAQYVDEPIPFRTGDIMIHTIDRFVRNVRILIRVVFFEDGLLNQKRNRSDTMENSVE